MFFNVVVGYHSALIIPCSPLPSPAWRCPILAGLCGALSGRVLDGVIVAAGSCIASWSSRAPCSTARITRTASTAHRHSAWLLRSVLLVVGLVVPTVSSPTGWTSRASAHAASTAVAVVAAEKASGTTAPYLAASILTVVHLVRIHLAVVLHRRASRSPRWWTIVRLVAATSTGTETALWRTLLLLFNMLLLLLLLLLRRRLLLLLTFELTLLDVLILAILGLWSRTTLTSLLPPLAVATAFLSGVRTSLHRLTLGTGHVGGFVTLLANDHIEFDHLTVANGTDGLFRVVASNG